MRLAQAFPFLLFGLPLTLESSPLELTVKILAVHGHHPDAYTQGLVWRGGKLFESTGQYGKSTLRQVDPVSGGVEQSIALDPEYFGEGLAIVDDRLVQLTWKEQTAFLYDLESLEQKGTWSYSGEGWGLCFDGEQIFMSDGSDTLSVRDPANFAENDRLQVTLSGRPIARINELECAEGWIYANVLYSESILRIDSDTGEVRATIDASGLMPPDEREGTDVLNGIAYNSASGTFYLTGKLWPKMYEVVFVETDD